jgi:protein-L-isoaspartate(D-aspartate) O-methyltransferase
LSWFTFARSSLKNRSPRLTGSGYQAAILARLVRKVCTVEIIPPLAEAATKVLRELGYDNVSVKIGDG